MGTSWVAILLMTPSAFAEPKHEEHSNQRNPARIQEKEHSSSEEIHWGYSGEHGPRQWGDLKTSYGMCKYGRNQSPVDLKDASISSRPALEIFYRPTRLNIENNGHTVKVNYSSGSYIRIDQKKFELLQFHFHSPSEHTKNGKAYPIEAHLVHKSKDGQLAVIGVFIEEGEIENEMTGAFWKFLPTDSSSAKLYKNIIINANHLIPDKRNLLRYRGSLTTPPCSEGVIWNVMSHSLKMSKNQIQKFQKIYSHNARPIQAINNRAMLGN